jgi:hypothetical protein
MISAEGVTQPPHTLTISVAQSRCDTPPSHLYVKENTTRDALRLCAPGFPCNIADCYVCGERVARNAQLDMLAKFAGFPSCISLRLSVARNADLDEAFRELATARRRFLETARLARTTHGYVRSTEITRDGALWNVHDHLIVFTPLDVDISRLLDAWELACQREGLTPSSHAQMSATVPALEYVLKSRLGSGKGSLRRLISRAAHGDLDAADDWREWDAWRRAHPRARFRASWLQPEARTVRTAFSAPRDQHITEATDAELAQLSILTALGVRSRAAQAGALGIGDSTVARRRRHFPDHALGASGRIAYRVS